MVVSLDEFLDETKGPLFDVRSPVEFNQGHIPGSYSLPLFTDDERAQVGTCYKHSGHDQAVMQGLKFVGPNLHAMAKTIKKIVSQEKNQEPSCRITCFRGGMRSASVQWLSQVVGVPAVRLQGGYKAFRQFVLTTLGLPASFIVIGGPTGSGKTDYLQLLKQKGLPVLDLEALANHRGSAFGLLPGISQPSTEQFENLLAFEMRRLQGKGPIFVEDESRLVGSCSIPNGIWQSMEKSPLLWLEVDKEERLQRIVKQYGTYPKEWLIENVSKLKKRLGMVRLNACIKALEENRIEDAARDLLEYYDDAYQKSFQKRPRKRFSLEKEAFETMISSSYDFSLLI